MNDIQLEIRYNEIARLYNRIVTIPARCIKSEDILVIKIIFFIDDLLRTDLNLQTILDDFQTLDFANEKNMFYKDMRYLITSLATIIINEREDLCYDD